MLCVEAVLRHLKWSEEDWLAEYVDLPNRLEKVAVRDRYMVGIGWFLGKVREVNKLCISSVAIPLFLFFSQSLIKIHSDTLKNLSPIQGRNPSR